MKTIQRQKRRTGPPGTDDIDCSGRPTPGTFHILQVITDEAGEIVNQLEVMQNGRDFLAVNQSPNMLLSGMSCNGNYYIRYGNYWVATEQANVTQWTSGLGSPYA